MDSGICEKDSKGGRAGGVLPLTATLSLMESRPLFFRMHWDHEPIVTNSCYTCNMNMSTYRRRFMERGRILAGRPANQAALALRQTRDFSSVV